MFLEDIQEIATKKQTRSSDDDEEDDGITDDDNDDDEARVNKLTLCAWELHQY